MKTAIAIAIAFLLCLVGAQSANAHQSSMSYASLELDDSGKLVHYEIRLSTKDLYEALSLGEDRDARDQEILDGATRLRDYVFERIKFRVATSECDFTALGVEVVKDGQRFARVSGELQCQERITSVDLDYQLFFDLDPRHEGLVRVGSSLYQLKESNHELVVKFAGGGSSRLGFLHSGWQHVIYGLDHILFLVALLMVVGLKDESSRRTTRETIHNTLWIVSSFTVAHSITLIAAALGWFSLPSRLVESVIAISILYVALENIASSAPGHRFRLTFLFGLIHGMGFASMLRPLLPPDESVVPLLLFNLGVELGQLTIVVGVLPALLLVLHQVGTDWYRRIVVTGLSLLLSILALVWLIERAAELTILGL